MYVFEITVEHHCLFLDLTSAVRNSCMYVSKTGHWPLSSDFRCTAGGRNRRQKVKHQPNECIVFKTERRVHDGRQLEFLIPFPKWVRRFLLRKSNTREWLKDWKEQTLCWLHSNMSEWWYINDISVLCMYGCVSVYGILKIIPHTPKTRKNLWRTHH